jgi:hypothetical protein
MFTLGPSLRLSLTGLALALSATVACGGGAESSGPPVTPYAGRQADLFDDSIEPALEGLRALLEA